jgi:hypothetical protein
MIPEGFHPFLIRRGHTPTEVDGFSLHTDPDTHERWVEVTTTTGTEDVIPLAEGERIYEPRPTRAAPRA